MTLRAIVGLLILVVSACAAPSHEGIDSASARLSIPGLTPWPCDSTGVTWEGNAVELMVADAWAGCSALDGLDFDRTYPGNDPYLQNVMQRIQVALGTPPPNVDLFRYWVDYRALASNGCDPLTGAPATAGVTIAEAVVPESVDYNAVPLDVERRKRANSDLREAGVNFCIAQTLRNSSPGASAGQTLLLPEADQRLLLETIRERAQIAMLQYALLGVVFSTTPQTLPGTPQTSQTIPVLQEWAASHFGDMQRMAQDFAGAVQLHSMVSQELLELFARSRSARSARGGQPATRADEIWGPGSWHQRTLAAAYGGDPLVLTDGTTPWTHWNPELHPLSSQAGVGWPLTTYDWPDTLKRPYTTVKASEPQVDELLRLAAQYNHIELVEDTTASCDPYDLEASAKAIYKNVEAEVRVSDCYRTNPTAPCPTVPVPPAYEYGGGTYLLFEKHRITLDHARTLVRLLAESLGGRKPALECGMPFKDAQFGARNLKGTATSASGITRLSKDSTFVNVTPWEVAPTYTRHAALRFPTPLELDPIGGALWDVGGQQLGFDDYCTFTGCPSTKNADAKRLMGAIAAQAATRDMIVESLGYLGLGLGQGATVRDSYFVNASIILKLLDAGIGPATVTLRPQLQRLAGTPPLAVVAGDFTSGFQSQVKVIVPADDTWWDWDCPATGGCNVITAAFAIEGPWARMLAAQPTTTVFDTTLLSLVLDAFNAGRYALGGTFSPSGGPFVPNMPKFWAASPLTLPSNALDAFTYTYLAVRFDFAAPPEEFLSFRLLGANVRVAPWAPWDGQYFGGSGALGSFVARQSAVRSTDPSEPAFDGFDLPTDWVPPLNAELIGGSAGEPSSAVYLKLAKESATTARSAVESALQDLLQQQQDDATLAAAAGKASAGVKEEKDRLCGNDNPKCDTSFSKAPIVNPLTDCNPSGLSEPDLSKCELQRFAFTLAKDAVAESVTLATPVVDSLSEPTVPAFSSYQGGSLQASFIEQWVAMRDMPTKLDLLQKTVAAANATYDSAWFALQAADAEEVAKCHPEKMKLAFFAGMQVHGVHFVTGPDASYDYMLKYDKKGDMSLGPILAQINACESAMSATNVAEPGVVLARNAAVLEVGGAAAGLIDGLGAIRLAAAKGAALVNEAKLAEGRHELEQKLTAQGLVTSFSVYRISRGYDLWRAKALVESSRRYGLAARRAIEARYVVDLSQLDKNEAFVASPKVWADEIYGYDLTLPAAVGLTLSGSSKGETIYPNKLTDYVSNLEAFVAGYAVTRPTAVANNDIDVVTLPGLKPGDPVQVPVNPSDPNSPTVTAHPSQGAWLVRCAASAGPPQWSTWPSACDGKVDRAKLLFTLDPWGRINGSVANEPFDKRHNSRWGLLAVNFVGTGIRDCQNAIDPKGCYSEPFIRYNLTHTGPSWVTDYDGRWRFLGLSTGKIEAGKGLAAELWLDPLKDGWSTSYISAAARSEWQQRSLGGAYELEFEVTPDVMLDRIERLQILVGSTSWVKQQ